MVTNSIPTENIEVSRCKHVSMNVAGITLHSLQVSSAIPTVFAQITDGQLFSIHRYLWIINCNENNKWVKNVLIFCSDRFSFKKMHSKMPSAKCVNPGLFIPQDLTTLGEDLQLASPLTNHWISGCGSPVALHLKVWSSPSVLFTLIGLESSGNWGAAVKLFYIERVFHISFDTLKLKFSFQHI